MKVSREYKKQLQRALISILIGAIITLITQVLELLLSLGRDKVLDLLATGSGMLYYLKSRRTA